MAFRFSKRSLRNLRGVHPDLVDVAHYAIQVTEIDFCITEGLRTIERQREMVAKGASRTMRSRHLSGHAIDVVAFIGISRVSWEMPLYSKINVAFQYAADELSVRVQWGGNWRKFKDGPHFQLPWRDYPLLDVRSA